jgi:uncharacterized membrane protein YcaP (DUF421 family)
MKEYEIHLDDLGRIFVGDAPPAFYLELVLRAAYVFVLLLISMRLLGKRMAAQLSRNDMAALVSLAAAVGVPVLAQDRGLLPSTIIAIVVVLLTRYSAILNFGNKKLESITIGNVSTLIEDGIINPREMHSSRLPRERLMAQLRSECIFHLGEVKRLYMESSGDFSIVRQYQPQPGLLSLPAWDDEFVDQVVDYTETNICLECGRPAGEPEVNIKAKCPNCGSSEYTKAVRRK